jgi:site-specific DNA recombinase
VQATDEDRADARGRGLVRILLSFNSMRRTKVIGYCRVSTLGQSLDGHSIANQRCRLEAYVAAYPDLELIGIECDEGVSAATLSRPALTRAFDALRTNRAGAMLVVEMSRLTRSVRDLQTVIEFFTGRRALLAVSESIDTRSPDGRLRLNIMASVNQHAREAGAARTSSAMQHMRSQGLYTGGRPRFGFSAGPDGTLIEDAAEQAILRTVRDARAAGRSLRGIVADLDARGMRSRAGRPFALAQVARMLAD